MEVMSKCWGLSQTSISGMQALQSGSQGNFTCRPLRAETAACCSSVGFWLSAKAHLHITLGLRRTPGLLRQKSFHFSFGWWCFRNHKVTWEVRRSQVSLVVSPIFFPSFLASPETLVCFTNCFHPHQVSELPEPPSCPLLRDWMMLQSSGLWCSLLHPVLPRASLTLIIFCLENHVLSEYGIIRHWAF